MWKYLTKEHVKEFILSLNLLSDKYSDEDKLKILYTISNKREKFYTPKYIDKKDGTKREILVPKPILKTIQKNILNNVLYNHKPSEYACGYVKGKSIKDNAVSHVNKAIVLKMDIKDFFSNITFEMVYNTLPNYIYPKEVKVLLLKLCTYYDYLPQGAPTSPYLSNLVMINFDKYIGEFCTKQNISYTRYCDDLTFSGNFNAKKLKNKVETFLEEIGFNINYSKTKVLKQNHRQTVTGLTVNKKININKTYRKKLRQEIYYINKYGLTSHCKYLHIDELEYLNKLQGKINYWLSINNNNKEALSYLKIINNATLKK